ncbi:MAG TPA: helix-turn-helix domain-containing protein, partial [Candidatus Eisenbacteria bacterium]|nr:helix-turn-helix domain-containing protein [Candidatus Eisenbacteria bacterium]
DLDVKVKNGTFREDLFYRLNVVAIALPSLRERPEDIPLLIERLLATIAARLRRDPKPIAPDAYRTLLAYAWPGNVRELEHAIEQAVALASGPEITLEDLPAAVQGDGIPAASSADPPGAPRAFKDAKQAVVDRFEREFLGAALARHQGNISKAADEVGMYRQQLQAKLAELGLDADRYRRREGG